MLSGEIQRTIENKHTQTHTPGDMHRWQEERQRPLGENKRGKGGWKCEESKKIKQRNNFSLFAQRKSSLTAFCPKHMNSQCEIHKEADAGHFYKEYQTDRERQK